jgi:hypothetical protein
MPRTPRQDEHMRGLLGLLVVAAVLFVVYKFHVEHLPVVEKGTVVTQDIDLSGVRTDLLQIAEAERAYIAVNGECVDIHELETSNQLAVIKTGRGGYEYSVACTGKDYSAIAEHAGASLDPHVRYPKLAVNQDMEVAELH